MAYAPWIKTASTINSTFSHSAINGIAADGAGNAWVSDGVNTVALVRISDGTVLVTITLTGQRPVPVCIAPDGSIWVGLTSGTGHVTKQIQTFSATGVPIASFNLPPDDNMLPFLIETDGTNMYVYAVETTATVFEMTTAGTILHTYATPNNKGISGMAVTPTNVWISDTGGNLYRLDKSLNLLATFPLGTYPSPAASGVVCGPTWDGKYLWLTDETSVIWQLSGDGILLKSFYPDSTWYYPGGYTGAGTMLMWDGTFVWIGVYTPNGETPMVVLIDPATDTLYGPFQIPALPDGDFVWMNLAPGSGILSIVPYPAGFPSSFYSLLSYMPPAVTVPTPLPYVILPYHFQACTYVARNPRKLCN
jgi:hypothetical protein